MIERSQVALIFCHIVGITLIAAHDERIVDMYDTRLRLCQFLAEVYILIATLLKAFVKTALLHAGTLDDKVGRAERAIGLRIGLVDGMLWFCMPFV